MKLREERQAVSLVVTSAAGANADGYGALLAFDDHGKPLGSFTRDSRIADPRGLAVDRKDGLLFVNSATDRVLAIDRYGVVVRHSGQINGPNPGGGYFGPDGRYYVGLRSARSIMAFTPGLDGRNDHILPLGIVPFPRGFAIGPGGRLFLASGMGPAARPAVLGKPPLLCRAGRGSHLRLHHRPMPWHDREIPSPERAGPRVLSLKSIVGAPENRP